MARQWVLLRGLIREQRHWEGFVEQMQSRFPGDTVVALDLPGNGSLHGDSSPTRIEAMVGALREQLSSRGLQPPFHVFSLSLGAMVTVSWMTDYPGEVAGAVLVNTSMARFSPFWHRLRPANYGRILAALLTRDRLTKERIILGITTNLIDDQTREAVARRWRDIALDAPVSTRNSLRQLRAAARFQAPAHLPGSLPVLVLNGGKDRLVSPRCSRALADAWDLPLKVHPEAGHDLTLDAGSWALDTLEDWLSGSG